jgi:hypothetical protein
MFSARRANRRLRHLHGFLHRDLAERDNRNRYKLQRGDSHSGPVSGHSNRKRSVQLGCVQRVPNWLYPKQLDRRSNMHGDGRGKLPALPAAGAAVFDHATGRIAQIFPGTNVAVHHGE